MIHEIIKTLRENMSARILQEMCLFGGLAENARTIVVFRQTLQCDGFAHENRILIIGLLLKNVGKTCAPEYARES